jgi:predicted RNase H-like HicB family nuclease
LRTVQTVNIQANLPWFIYQDPDSKYWIGVCEPLRITLSGKKWPELMEVIDEALQLLMIDLVKTGEIDAFLKKQGWTAGPLPAKVDEHVRFDIPMNIFKGRASDLQDAIYQQA